MDGDPNQTELSAAMRAAHQAWLSAVAEKEKTRSEYRDMLHHPDGSRALYEAARHELEARQNYWRALKAFADHSIPQRMPA